MPFTIVCSRGSELETAVVTASIGGYGSTSNKIIFHQCLLRRRRAEVESVWG